MQKQSSRGRKPLVAASAIDYILQLIIMVFKCYIMFEMQIIVLMDLDVKPIEKSLENSKIFSAYSIKGTLIQI